MTDSYAISTRWNAYRHPTGEALLEDIVTNLGMDQVELGYDLTLDLVPGVRNMVKQGAVRVSSVHNYCPVPVGAPHGHPELWLLGSTDARSRAGALTHTRRTVEFAAEMGAGVVVCHAGNVPMRRYTRKLIGLAQAGHQYSPRYERVKTRLLLQREKKAPVLVDHLSAGLEELLPFLEEHEIVLALENLPSWEALPTEAEIETLCRRFDSPYLRYWHDIGHGQVRHNLGLSAHLRWFEKLAPWMGGLHIHDVAPPARDHVMPPAGNIDFKAFAAAVPRNVPLVFEPAPGTPVEALRDGIAYVREAWGSDTPDADEATGGNTTP